MFHASGSTINISSAGILNSQKFIMDILHIRVLNIDHSINIRCYISTTLRFYIPVDQTCHRRERISFEKT